MIGNLIVFSGGAVFAQLDTKLNLSTTDYLESDGQTERVNQVLEDMLQAYGSKRQSNWEDYLSILEFAYNSAKHVFMGYSPFMLMYGYQPKSPVMVGLANERIQFVKDFLSDHMDMLQLARQNIRRAQDCFKKFADVKQRMVTFDEGDQVFLRVQKKLQSLFTSKVPKLSPR